jgi:hypothetical protein
VATIPLKELVKVQPLVRRIESGAFDANDVDALLIKLRPYARRQPVFREVADFVAHADARDRGVACDSMTAFADAMRFFVEYSGPRQQLDIAQPFPAYIRRLFRSQTTLANEEELKRSFRISRHSLLKKIDSGFAVDKASGLCRLRPGKDRNEFIAALQYVTGFIHSKPAFAISDFHGELRALLAAEGIEFNDAWFAAQADRVSLSILCLLSGTEFELPDGDLAACALCTEHHYRILEGQRRTPIGEVTPEPAHFGTLQICGQVKVISQGRPVTIMYPVVTTELEPHDHCDSSVFEVLSEANEFGQFRAEFINLEPHMALTPEFKLIRATRN